MKCEKINITKIVNKGYGLAHLSSGQVILVRQALPNETVIITIEETKKNLLFGRVKEIKTKHPSRVTAPCRYYGQCGGCDLQHCNYTEQLHIKKGILIDLLDRGQHPAVREAVHLLAAPLPAPDSLAYRQRIRLQVGERGVLGFHRFQSHEIIPITNCLLAGDSINRAINSLQQSEEGASLCHLATEVEIQLNPVTDKTVLIFHFSRRIRPADSKTAIRFCKENPEVERIFFTGEDFPINGPYSAGSNEKKGEPSVNILTVQYPQSKGQDQQTELELSWEAGGFCQVNLAQNRVLIETVRRFCQVKSDESILDLFCGMGNFSIPLAQQAANLLGIEGQGSAIRSAKKNAIKNGLSNCQFIKSPAHLACKELAEEGQVFDCVLIDPPRQGAPGLAGHLAALTRHRLVYISCDPATLCRDLAELTEKGFIIKKIQPIDMFPQTHHIETIVLLEKKSISS